MQAAAFYRRSALAMAFLAASLILSGCFGGKDVRELRASAIEAFSAGDYAGAEKLFDEALEAGRGTVSEVQIDILKYRGECELRQGKYDEAKTTYEALLHTDGAEENLEKYEGFVSELENLDKLSAMVDGINSGKYQETYELASETAALDGTLTGKISWFNKAVCAEHLGNYEEAYELFNEYLKVYPEDQAAEKEADFLRTR